MLTDTDSPMEDSADDEGNAAEEVEAGKFVLVKFAGKKKNFAYVGMVIGRQDSDWRVDFYRRTPQGRYVKPDQEDVALVEPTQILKVIGAPASTGTTVRTLGSISFGKGLIEDPRSRVEFR